MNLIELGLLLLMTTTVGLAQKTTSTTTTPHPIDVFRNMRKEHVTKDADIIIKMTRDFIKDMKLKMVVIKRVEKKYDQSADFTTGAIFSDINRKFKHMCDLYKNFATVRRYVLGHELNKTFVPNPDVVPIYQFMLSDYNEILLLLELFSLEQNAWKDGAADEKSRAVIGKQLAKFGDLPAVATLPSLVVHDPNADTKKGDEVDKKQEKKPDRRRDHRRPVAKWKVREDQDSGKKWSGELDGVGFDNR